MNIDCTLCGEPIDLDVTMRTRPLQPVDGPLACYMDIDAKPLRDHILATHGGPNGGGGEPVPVPRTA